MKKQTKKEITISLIIAGSLVLLGLVLDQAFTIYDPQSYYEFDFKGYHWKCVGELRNVERNIDYDFRDGSIYGKYSSQSDTTARISTSVDGIYSFIRSWHEPAGSKIDCYATNFSFDGLQEVKVLSTGSMSVNGDGSYTVWITRGSLTDTLSYDGHTYSRSKYFTDFSLKKGVGGTWITVDDSGNSQPITYNNPLYFAVETQCSSNYCNPLYVDLNIRDIILVPDQTNEITRLLNEINALNLTLQQKLDYINTLGLTIDQKNQLIATLQKQIDDQKTLTETITIIALVIIIGFVIYFAYTKFKRRK